MRRFKYLNICIYSNIQIVDSNNSISIDTGEGGQKITYKYLNIWIYSNIWIFEYSNIWIFEYSNIWIFHTIMVTVSRDRGSEDHIQIFEYLQICVYSIIQIFRKSELPFSNAYSNIWINANIWVFKYLYFFILWTAP